MILPTEKQCVSLKTAIRMRDLGFRQDSSFFWRVYKATGEAVLTSDDYCKANKGDYEHYSAYTTSELGVILNVSGIYTSFCGSPKASTKIIIKFSLEEYKANTEVEARGLMACYRKENNSL